MLRLLIPCLASSAMLVLAAASSPLAADQAKSRPAGRSPFSEDVRSRSFRVSGKVVSIRGDTMVVRIDDHGHRIPFTLGPNVRAANVAAGSRVSVRYHPTGSVGQMADEVEVAAGSR